MPRRPRRLTPQIKDGVLLPRTDLGICEPILVGHEAWWIWLANATCFAFSCPEGHFTARRESRRRGDHYWYGYLSHNGKLHNTYLGKAGDLSLERLVGAAEQLVLKKQSAQSTTRRARTIGVLIPYIGHNYFGGVLTGAHVAAKQSNAQLVVVLGDPATNITVGFARHTVDAWIVVEWTADVTTHLPYDLPLIFVGSNDGNNQCPSVSADSRTGFRNAVLHLLEHGHTRIAFTAPLKNAARGGDVLERYAGYAEALQEHGILLDPDLVISTDAYTRESGIAAGKQLLSEKLDCTAVVAGNDELAMGIMQVVQAAGLRIPQDLAIVGYDGHEGGQSTDPILTSIRLSFHDLGFHAVQLAITQLESGIAPQSIILPTELVVHQSCGCTEHNQSSPVHVVQGENWQRILRQRLATVSGTDQHEMWIAVLAHGVTDALEGKLELPATTITLACRAAAATTADPLALRSVLEVIRETVEQQLVRSQVQQVPEAVNVFLDHVAGEFVRVCWANEYNISQKFYQHITVNYEITSDLFNNAPHARTLAWLTQTDVHAGFLALWERAEQPCQLVVSSVYSQDGDDLLPLHTQIDAADVPPRTQLSRLTCGGHNIVLLLPIASSQHWGVLALSVPTSAPIVSYDTWANLLGLSLEREQLLESLQKAKQMAEVANQAKGRLLSVVSHELRTPLSLIIGLSELVRHESSAGAMPASSQSDLERIYTSANHLDGLLRDVLDLADGSPHSLNLVSKAVPLEDVLYVATTLGEQLVRGKGLTWHTNIPPKLPVIVCDRTRLQQVLVNLLTNAVKFAEQGTITLEVAVSLGTPDMPNHEVCIAISDTGSGIPLLEQERIFDAFYQLEHTQEREYDGMGLGLAICKRIIDLHKGTIEVESRGIPGEGSTFRVRLPILTEAQSHAVSTSPTFAQQAPIVPPLFATLDKPLGNDMDGDGSPANQVVKTILIVDDDPSILAMHARMLQAHAPALRVLTADSGQAALAAVGRQWVDAVMLDLHMPEIDGFRVLTELRRRETTRHIPVVVLTAQLLTEPEMAQLNVPYTTVLSKGVFTAKELLAHVDAALARTPRPGGDTQRLVRRAMAYIHTHYPEPLTRDQLARYAGVNANHLSRSFQQELKISPMTYLMRYRIRQAKELLASQTLSVTDVAFRVGFVNETHFMRVFRQEAGVSPTGYRRGEHQ